MRNNYNFGDILLLKFPFSNAIGYKKRPVFVLADTGDNDIVVCRISSKIYDTEFDIIIENWSSIGLKLESVIRLHKVATLEKDLVDKQIGKINNNLKSTVIDKYHKILETL